MVQWNGPMNREDDDDLVFDTDATNLGVFDIDAVDGRGNNGGGDENKLVDAIAALIPLSILIL